jgi:uncharacterized protein
MRSATVAGRGGTPGPTAHTAPGIVAPGHASDAAWFVALCLALTLAASVASAAIPALVPFVLALGPAVIALALAWHEGHGSVRRLLRTLTIRPTDRRWYLVLAIPLGWALAVVAVVVALGRSDADPFARLGPSALIVPLVVLLPAFAEELAWRGFALPRAMAVMSPLRASLLLAIPWALMHLVLQLPGGMNAGVAIWPTIVSIAAYSIILTWIFIGTGGSVLITALVHTGLNGVAPLMAGLDTETVWATRAVVAAIIAIIVVGRGGLDAARRTTGQTGP